MTVIKVREYAQEIPSGLQTNLRHREKEPHNNHEIQEDKQNKATHRDDCKTRMEQNNTQLNIEQLQNPTMGITININIKIRCF